MALLRTLSVLFLIQLLFVCFQLRIFLAFPGLTQCVFLRLVDRSLHFLAPLLRQLERC